MIHSRVRGSTWVSTMSLLSTWFLSCATMQSQYHRVWLAIWTRSQQEVRICNLNSYELQLTGFLFNFVCRWNYARQHRCWPWRFKVWQIVSSYKQSWWRGHCETDRCCRCNSWRIPSNSETVIAQKWKTHSKLRSVPGSLAGGTAGTLVRPFGVEQEWLDR